MSGSIFPQDDISKTKALAPITPISQGALKQSNNPDGRCYFDFFETSLHKFSFDEVNRMEGCNLSVSLVLPIEMDHDHNVRVGEALTKFRKSLAA